MIPPPTRQSLMGIDQPVCEWIDSVCRQFSRATGWPLSFVAIDEDVSEITQADTQWRVELSNGTQIVGALCLGQPRPRDESYLQACEFAELTAQLVERALSERTSHESLRVHPTSETPSASSGGVSVTIDRGTRNDQSILYVDRLLRMVSRLSGYPAAALFLLKRGTNQLNLYAQQTPEWITVPHPERSLEQAPIDQTCLHGEAGVISRSESSDEAVNWLPNAAAIGVCHPIVASGEKLGTLWMYDRRDRRLTLRDRHVMASVVSRLAELIERTILLDETARSQRLRVELQVAARTQPSSKIQYRSTDGWFELFGHSQASEEVGGDLFEVISLDDDRVFVAIGDAAGHSIPAALVMASVRGAIRAIFDPTLKPVTTETSTSPHVVLRRLNSVLHGLVNSHQFMTMFCAIIDRRHMHMEYASAGHPPMLLVRKGDVQTLDTPGLVLGVLDDTSYVPTTVPLEEGDLFAFSTDGVTEAVDRERSMFGTKGIANILIQHQQDDAATIVDRAWAALQNHLSPESPDDDRTLVVLRIDRTANSPLPPTVEVIPDVVSEECHHSAN